MRFVDDFEPSSHKRKTIKKESGWTIRDIAEAKGVSKHRLISLAGKTPLPQPLFEGTKGNNRQKYYRKSDLENWYNRASNPCP